MELIALPAGKQSLQARKQEFARDAIFTAAIGLFADKGFEETTIDDIVAAAGTSRRTFFRHFESKRDLMAQPVGSYGDTIARSVQSCPPGASHAELFRHVVLTVAQRTVADTRMRRVMEVAAKYPAARDAQVSRMAEVQGRVAEAFIQRCGNEITAHVLASLTLIALSLTYRVWFAEGKKDIFAAVHRVYSELREVTGLPQSL